MEAGATDGLALRNAGIPSYGVSAVFEEQNDVRAHGRDERLSVQSFYDALEFWYRMLQAFASGRLTRGPKGGISTLKKWSSGSRSGERGRNGVEGRGGRF